MCLLALLSRLLHMSGCASMSLQHARQCFMWRCNPLLQALVSEGKIKYVGISEASPAEIKKAHSICPLTAIQIEYSLWSRDVEGELAPCSSAHASHVDPFRA